MELIGPRHSAFVARVRLALALKGLAYRESAIPDGGLGGKAFLALNPLGRVPVLVVDDGFAIAESETILAFLDKAHPAPPLLPADWRARARVRTVVRLTDNYLTPAIECLYPFQGGRGLDPMLLGYAIADLKAILSTFRPLIGSGRFPILPTASMADCVLFPALYLAERVTTELGLESALGAASELRRYYETAKADPVFGEIYAESIADLPNPDLRKKLTVGPSRPGGSPLRRPMPSTEQPAWAGQSGQP